VDKLICLFVAWLKGNSLLQTVFTCLYLHDVDEVSDPRLGAVCTAVLKAVEHVTEVVNRSDVWEEEDFSARYP
jgi:hypothetical protein